MENAYAVSIDQVIQDLQTDEKRGLDDKEASARLVKYGKNGMSQKAAGPHRC
jgi:magnesium-transporting ATPase (P-type)